MVTPTIKVNDICGNSIEIGTVVVWRVVDAARPSFDVENLSRLVDTQCESALRHLASIYLFDAHEEMHDGKPEGVRSRCEARRTRSARLSRPSFRNASPRPG